jgi:hypothetical protein
VIPDEREIEDRQNLDRASVREMQDAEYVEFRRLVEGERRDGKPDAEPGAARRAAPHAI